MKLGRGRRPDEKKKSDKSSKGWGELYHGERLSPVMVDNLMKIRAVTSEGILQKWSASKTFRPDYTITKCTPGGNAGP